MKKVKFGDLFDFEKKSKVKAGEGLSNGKYPFFTSSNILSKRLNEFQFNAESLIFGTGGQASIHYCNEKFNVSTDCFVTTVKDNNVCHSKYVSHFLSGNIHLLEKEFKGAGLKHISKNAIQNLSIPLPPLTEQKHIAKVLDKADELVKKNKALLQEYNALQQAIFLDMFGDPVTNPKGWKILALKEMSEKIIDCPHSTPKHSEEITEFASIRTTELRNGLIDWSSMKYVDEFEYQNRTKRIVPVAGDIIYGREGSFGEAAIVPPDKKICLGQRVVLFRNKKNVTNNVFLWALLRSNGIYFQALKKNTGSTVGHVNMKDIIAFTGICPPIALQNKFASIIENIEQQKEKAKESLVHSEELFNALVGRYFGKK